MSKYDDVNAQDKGINMFKWTMIAAAVCTAFAFFCGMDAMDRVHKGQGNYGKHMHNWQKKQGKQNKGKEPKVDVHKTLPRVHQELHRFRGSHQTEITSTEIKQTTPLLCKGGILIAFLLAWTHIFMPFVDCESQTSLRGTPIMPYYLPIENTTDHKMRLIEIETPCCTSSDTTRAQFFKLYQCEQQVMEKPEITLRHVSDHSPVKMNDAKVLDGHCIEGEAVRFKKKLNEFYCAGSQMSDSRDMRNYLHNHDHKDHTSEAFHQVCRLGSSRLVELMVQGGSIPDMKCLDLLMDNYWQSINLQGLKLFVNTPDKKAQSRAFLIACRMGPRELVKAFMHRGVKVNKLCLDFAKLNEWHNPEVKQYVLKKFDEHEKEREKTLQVQVYKGK
jgi:hypothetical protein